MRLNRIGALAALLLTTSACSHLPMGPTAYSALPSNPPAGLAPATLPATLAPAAAPLAEAAPVRPETDVALAPVVIPGTWKLRDVETRRGSVNPLAALEASVRTRLAWETLHPEDLSEQPKPAARSFRSLRTDVTETSATSAAGSPAGSPAKASADAKLSAEPPATYNREAAMTALLKGGKDAAKSICSGC